MLNETHQQKVTVAHIKRKAYLYIRQSTLRQVFENTESTKRQYALRDKAIALGWPPERIIVIDTDLGKSGANTDREGFQKLITAVSMGEVGIVLGLEVSRLARNSMDWHRLIEICALTKTLISDEDGVYDPCHFNDRLLLGLKGTMSEAELHVIQARLLGGLYNKAKRGELRLSLPVGLIYDHNKNIQYDPDKQVQESIRLLFSTFEWLGSATATVKYFRAQAIQFPSRPRVGIHKGELLWLDLSHSRVLEILHNPRYAGAFVFGRTKVKRNLEGKSTVHVNKEDWQIVIPNAHVGYISWQTYEKNLKQLRENAYNHEKTDRKTPPREGPALLQGLVICGKCGLRMTVRYKYRKNDKIPIYMCQREGIKTGQPACQHIHGKGIDEAIGKILLETITPLNTEVTFMIQKELQSRFEHAELLRKQHVERAKYEADLARRRFMKVDPDNRLVADTLEGDWNNKLRDYHAAQEEYERQKQKDCIQFSEQEEIEIKKLVEQFPKIWHDSSVSHRERKRLVRTVIEDVTLKPSTNNTTTMYIRFKGGVTKTIEISQPSYMWEIWQTPQAVVDTIDNLLNNHTTREIVAKLNKTGLKSGKTRAFNHHIVRHVIQAYHLKSYYERLRERGFLTAEEIGKLFNITPACARSWYYKGYLKASPYDDKGSLLFEDPGANPPVKYAHKKKKIR